MEPSAAEDAPPGREPAGQAHGPGPTGGAGSTGGTAPADGAGSTEDALPAEEASPKDDAGPKDDIGPKNDAGLKGDIGPENDAGSKDDAGPNDDIGPNDDTVVLATTILPPAPRTRPPDAVRAAELPSWPQVLATTLRLWAQRRVGPPASSRRRWIIAVILVVMVLAAAAATVTLTRNSTAGRGDAGNGALGAAAAARGQAAAWVTQQVAADAIVACDPAMCSALEGKGIAASRLLVLQSGNADPLGSDVVMATAAVRSQFGSRLASVYAPEVLVSFGAGSARIVIRAVAPDGSAAYRAALQADVQARMAVGQQLLGNARLQASATARQELAAGEIDTRLLTTLATLAALYPIDVVGFGGASAHASAGVPLRYADISGTAGAAGARSAVSLSSLKSFLLAQRAPYLPAEVNTVRLATGQAVLRIEFTAPSPLGLLGTDS